MRVTCLIIQQRELFIIEHSLTDVHVRLNVGRTSVEFSPNFEAFERTER